MTLLVGNGGSGNPRTNIPHKNELHKNTVLVFQDGYWMWDKIWIFNCFLGSLHTKEHASIFHWKHCMCGPSSAQKNKLWSHTIAFLCTFSLIHFASFLNYFLRIFIADIFGPELCGSLLCPCVRSIRLRWRSNSGG